MNDRPSPDPSLSELRRTTYLSAMGVDSYVSRGQLPGAAPSRRLAIVPTSRTMSAEPAVSSGPAALASAVAAIKEKPAAQHSVPIESHREAPRAPQVSVNPDRFSMASIVAGGILWLEELHGVPLAREQVQLAVAMSRAMGLAPETEGSGPEVTQFNWPIHNNAQLDQGQDASRAALAGFVYRKLDQHQCLGLVLLGAPGAARLPLSERPSLAHCQIPSTLELLNKPGLKKKAWAGLQGIVRAL